MNRLFEGHILEVVDVVAAVDQAASLSIDETNSRSADDDVLEAGLLGFQGLGRRRILVNRLRCRHGAEVLTWGGFLFLVGNNPLGNEEGIWAPAPTPAIRGSRAGLRVLPILEQPDRDQHEADRHSYERHDAPHRL